jgi:cyclophilin family peptidyl-prolyl cis-trans isomerase
MGRAQKLKQQRKEEEIKRKEAERKDTYRKITLIVVIILVIAITVGLVFLVNYMKKQEEPMTLEEAQELDNSVSTVQDEVGVSNLPGAVGMAKPSDPETQEPMPDSATSQFYIIKNAAPEETTFLDSYFTIFGEVTEGMDVVNSLVLNDDLFKAEIRETEDGEGGSIKEWVLETNKGDIVIRLLTEETPLTTQHIIDLTEQGFYDELKWYRVEEFVVQTGSHVQSVLSMEEPAQPEMPTEPIEIPTEGEPIEIPSEGQPIEIPSEGG